MQKKPFFLYIAQGAPHFPLHGAAERRSTSTAASTRRAGTSCARRGTRGRSSWALVDPAWPLSAAAARESPAWDSLSDEDKDRFDHMMAIYAAMIDRIDFNVGKLVDDLKERGVLDNTLILFLSDNGGNAEAGPQGRYEGKRPGAAGSTVFLGKSWATLANTPLPPLQALHA